MRIRNILAAGVMFLAIGCTAPTYDASSETAQKESVKRLRDSLPEDQREKFDQSLMVVAMDGVELRDFASGTFDASEALAKLDGKTAGQIIEEADRIAAAREAKAREQAMQEIAELHAREAQAATDRAALERFQVERSRFRMQSDRYSFRAQPQIELTLRNGTDKAVARVYARGVLATPGRSVPWIDQEFNFSIAGGIEPGEDYQTVLEPNMFSDWGKVDPPTDAVFTVEIVEIEGADGEPVFSSRRFSEADAQRLAELEAQFD